MNGYKGLAIAAVLGVLGAILNWFYLDSKVQELDSVEYLGIAQSTVIRPGDRFTEEQLVKVAIPKNAQGELPHFAVLYSDRQTVIGMPAVRLYAGGELVLRQDLKSPPPALSLARENERAMWIPVDTRTFVPSLVNPGDMVSFLVGETPTPAAEPGPDGEEAENPPPTPLPTAELIGPFRVLSLGNRLGSSEVLKAAGISQQQENVMTVSINVNGGQLDPKAAKLWRLLRLSSFQQVGVLLHPHTKSQP